MKTAQFDLVLPGTGGRYLLSLAAARRFVQLAEEKGLEVRNIYAASGGVFGAIHISAGYENPRDWIDAHWDKTKQFKLGGWRIFKQAYNLIVHRGIFRWEAVSKVLCAAHPHKELRIPVWIVVWDLSRNRELLIPVHEWRDGDIGEAMAISCSLPLMFTPPRLQVKNFPKSIQPDMLADCGPKDYITLTDGSLSSNTPADIATQIGFEPIPVVVVTLDNFGGYDRSAGQTNVLDHLTRIVSATLEANRQEDKDPGEDKKVFTIFVDSHGFEDQAFKFNITKSLGLRMIDRGVREVNRRVREAPWIFDAVKGTLK